MSCHVTNAPATAMIRNRPATRAMMTLCCWLSVTSSLHDRNATLAAAMLNRAATRFSSARVRTTPSTLSAHPANADASTPLKSFAIERAILIFS